MIHPITTASKTSFLCFFARSPPSRPSRRVYSSTCITLYIDRELLSTTTSLTEVLTSPTSIMPDAGYDANNDETICTGWEGLRPPLADDDSYGDRLSSLDTGDSQALSCPQAPSAHPLQEAHLPGQAHLLGVQVPLSHMQRYQQRKDQQKQSSTATHPGAPSGLSSAKHCTPTGLHSV